MDKHDLIALDRRVLAQRLEEIREDIECHAPHSVIAEVAGAARSGIVDHVDGESVYVNFGDNIVLPQHPLQVTLKFK